MNVALKTLTAALALAGVMANASAAVDGPASADGLPANGVGTGNGDLILAYEANSPSGVVSIMWDLSDGANDLDWTSMLSAGAFTISNAAVSSFVADNPNGRWNLFGLTNTKTSGAASTIIYNQAGFGTTVNGAPDMSFNGGQIEVFADNNSAWISALNQAGLDSSDTVTATAADFHQFDAGTTHSAFIAGQNATGLLGETLGYWNILINDELQRGLSAATANRALSAPANLAQLGSFTFAANGELSYSPVPLPPAVWLFGSALAGVAGFRRRRAA